MANDEDRFVGSCQTDDNSFTEDPKKITWKGHKKIIVQNEFTDTLFYFDVINLMTGDFVSKG